MTSSTLIGVETLFIHLVTPEIDIRVVCKLASLIAVTKLEI